jgi:dolichol-phosphate mannosyltransferase
MLREQPLLSVVIPVFNEEESLPETVRRLLALGDKLLPSVDLELLFVDDGSRDNSLAILKGIAASQSSIKIIAFSRNFGHQIAITAGIDLAAGDYVAVIDADLQDPPELIEAMYQLALTGYDVVYGKRRSRAGETVFKRASAAAFYRLFSYMCEMDIPTDTGDFRLMSRRVVEAFKQLRERHRFVRGMIPWVGFRATPLEYDRDERYAGETKYPLRKMLTFATNAILSFSKKPLTLAIRLGFMTILVGVVLGFYVLYLKLFTSIPVPGITAVLLSIVVFSGVQILLIGIVGEYIARIFEEVKGRPLYLVAETVNL